MAEGPQAVRSIVAVGAGFFTAAMLSVAGTWAFTLIAPDVFNSQRSGARLGETAYAFVCECLGGYVTARLAILKPVLHAVMTGFILLAISVVLTALANATDRYVIVAWLLVVPACALGGKLREMQVSRG